MTESIRISPALSALCQRHGINFSGLSAIQIAENLPRIFDAVISEHRSNRELLSKSALHVRQVRTFCLPDFVRDEKVSDSSESFANPNDIFSSLMPG